MNLMASILWENVFSFSFSNLTSVLSLHLFTQFFERNVLAIQFVFLFLLLTKFHLFFSNFVYTLCIHTSNIELQEHKLGKLKCFAFGHVSECVYISCIHNSPYVPKKIFPNGRKTMWIIEFHISLATRVDLMKDKVAPNVTMLWIF